MNVESLAETLREHAPPSEVAPKRPGTLTGVIKVHLLRAVGLKAMDSNGLSDPYVVIKLGDKVIGRSNVIFATLNPTWDEHFECHVTDCAEALIQVYDYDRLSADDLCGEAILPLAGQADGVNDISDGHVYERVVQLTPMVRHARYAGGKAEGEHIWGEEMQRFRH